jgi:hypothetical protein
VICLALWAATVHLGPSPRVLDSWAGDLSGSDTLEDTGQCPLQWFYDFGGVHVLQLIFRDSFSFRCQICRVVRMSGVDPVMTINSPLASHLMRKGRGRSPLQGSVQELRETWIQPQQQQRQQIEQREVAGVVACVTPQVFVTH